MAEEKRMAGDYTIIRSFHIGPKEVVLGENAAAAPGEHYLCAFCEWNDLLALYNDVLVSDNYTELVGIFADRVAEQNEILKAERNRMKEIGVDLGAFPAESINPISWSDDLQGKVLVLKPENLRPEYRVSAYQLVLCTGGGGASGTGRGSAVFCTDLFYGASERYGRPDILGIVPRDKLPEWAQKNLAQIEEQRSKEKRSRGQER